MSAYDGMIIYDAYIKKNMIKDTMGVFTPRPLTLDGSTHPKMMIVT